MTDPYMPWSAVDVIGDRLGAIMTDHTVVKRPLAQADPAKTLSVFPTEAIPDLRTFEMPSNEPTLKVYKINIINQVKGVDREETSRSVGANTKMVEKLLYRDNTLRLGLAALTSTVLGRTERFQRLVIARQRYDFADLRTAGLSFFNTTEIQITTETIAAL